MDWQKNLLLAGMAAVVILLIIRWDKFQQEHQAIAAPTQSVASSTVNNISSENNLLDIPEAITAGSTETEGSVITHKTADSQIVTVATNTLLVDINTKGGDIVKVSLPKYFAHVDTPEQPFVLIDNSPNKTYILQSGLVGKNGTDTSAGRPQFSVSARQFSLPDGEQSLAVDLVLEQDNATITKRFIFHRDQYWVNVEYIIDNKSDTPWQGNLYAQIKRDDIVPSTTSGIGMKPFLGPAITTREKHYQKFTFEEIQDGDFKTKISVNNDWASITGGWVSMVQHYFISAWIPDPETTNHYNLRQLGTSNLYMMGFTGDPISVAAHSTSTISAKFYAGPKDTKTLETLSPYLDLTVDYGWLWWIAKPLFTLLKYIQSFVSNWGISIILLTVCIKAVFFKLSATSYRSMARMRKLSPKMAELKERYGDDRQKMSQETMKLYKTEKVNPLGGCLPMLIQMPVFLALYWMLMESVELRHTAFLWMNDLSVKDPIFILPVLMGFTMWLTMRLNPAPPDPMQAKIMQFMPVGMTFMFLWFPAGLVLYWVTNNTLSFIQQRIITRQIDNEDKKPPKAA